MLPARNRRLAGQSATLASVAGVRLAPIVKPRTMNASWRSQPGMPT